MEARQEHVHKTAVKLTNIRFLGLRNDCTYADKTCSGSSNSTFGDSFDST
jgi:hypothetical protein